MTMEDRIALTLRAAGERIEVGEGRPNALRTLDPNPRPKVSRLVAFAGAFAAVIFVAFGLSLMTPAALGPIGTNASLLRISDSGPLEWRNLVDLTTATVEFLAHGPAGWVALTKNNRQSSDYSNAPILGSADGVEWFELRPDGLPDAVHVGGVVGYAAGYVAFGLYASPNYTATTIDRPSNFAEPAIWTSADGSEWSQVPLPLPPVIEAISEVVSYRVHGVFSIGGSVVALGSEWDEVAPEGVQDEIEYPTGVRGITWMADEAGGWRLVGGSPLVDVWAVASGPAGVLALSSIGSGFGIWSTVDGIHWNQVAIVRDGPLAFIGSENGYLLSGLETILFSTDGVTWSQVEGIDGLVGSGPGGFVSFGSTVQWSPDGQRWREVGPSDLLADLEWTPTVGVDMGAVIIPGRDQSGAGQLVVGTNG